jgi:hypothetical protein
LPADMHEAVLHDQRPSGQALTAAPVSLP